MGTQFDTLFARSLQTQQELIGKRNNDSFQRRNGIVDNYGIEYTRQGSYGSPAAFTISVSPDLIYYERFEFKIILSPFVIPIESGAGDGATVAPATVSISAVNLDITSDSIGTGPADLEIRNGDEVSPNPHHHSLPTYSIAEHQNPHSHISTPHTHQVSGGVTTVPVGAENFEIWIGDVEITDYLIEQHPDGWLSSEGGIFPSSSPTINFDLLEVAGLMNEEERENMLSQGYKEIKIYGDGLFTATYVSYLKYSYVNR